MPVQPLNLHNENITTTAFNANATKQGRASALSNGSKNAAGAPSKKQQQENIDRLQRPMSNKDRTLKMRAEEKALNRFKAAYDAKLQRCQEAKARIEPILVKLWDLAGQPDSHGTIEDDQNRKNIMAKIPMTTIPHEQFMKFLGTLQLLLFGIRPSFYPESYLKEI